MARRDNSSMSNNKREWKSIKILGAEYVISNSATKNSWKILLSNLIEIWSETITETIALARCESLNLLLDLDSFEIKKTLDMMLNDIPNHATQKSVDEIKLETCIDGIVFKFTINLTKGSPEQFWNEITKPLCQSSMELQHRHKIILDLIKKKDKEISEYKLSGAQLIRKNIETLPYNQNIFENKETIRNSKLEDCITAFQSVIDLYNELNKCESLLNNLHDHLPQQSSDSNPVEPVREPKRENTQKPGMTLAVDINNDNELQSACKIEATSEHSPICENESIAFRTEITEQYEEGQRPSVSKSAIRSRTEKHAKNQSSVKNVANMPLISIEQSSKKPKRLKVTRNIYDFIA